MIEQTTEDKDETAQVAVNSSGLLGCPFCYNVLEIYADNIDIGVGFIRRLEYYCQDCGQIPMCDFCNALVGKCEYWCLNYDA